MNIRKLLALMLAFALCLSLIPSAFAKTSEKTAMSEAEREAKIAELLDFSTRLHDMKTEFGLKLDKAASFEDPYANGRLIVKSGKALTFDGALASVKGPNDRYVVQYASAELAAEAAAKLRKLEGVEYVSPDQIMTIAQQPHDNTFLSWGFGAGHVDAFNYNEWILEEMDLSELPEVIVGICDTGIDASHPFLADSCASGGWDFVNNDSNPNDEHYHGTHVAGTVVDGTLPNVKVMGLRVLDADGYGDTSDIVNGMEYANLHGCKVVNLSLRGPRSEESYQAYSEVINNGTDNGTVYCVASGNDGGSSENYCPGCVGRAFTVAAHDSNRAMAYFSNTGSSVDITAPGVNIRSASPGGGYRNLDGTSMATPHVAAACALVYSFDPDMDPDAVIDTIKGAARPANFTGGGTGTLNVTDLLKYDSVLNGEGSDIHFTSSGNYPWGTDENCAFSTNEGVANSTSTLNASLNLGAYQRISFEYKVSSEQGDYFRFKVGSSTELEVSGSHDWQIYEGSLDAFGITALTWEFAKNASGDGGQDKAWIRNVRIIKTISTVMNGGSGQFLFSEENEYPWVVDGNAAKSGNSGVNNSVSKTITTKQCEEGITFIFEYKTECGTGDSFKFFVNGNCELTVSATTGWQAYEYTIPSTGTYTFEFRFEKNGSGSTGADCAWVKGCDLIHTVSSALNVPGGHLSFINNSQYPWVAEGEYAKSGNRNIASTSSVLRLTVDMQQGDTLSFRYRISSESNYDWLTVTANGTTIVNVSGTGNWTEYIYTAPSDGSYTFNWTYSKDGSVNSNDDCAYLDDVCLTTSAPQYTPGDVDGDGNVTVTDALIVMRIAMGIFDGDYIEPAADYDGDGSITVTDALMIMRAAMGL